MVDGLEDDGLCCGMAHDMQTQPSLQEQIQAVAQMRGRDGLRALKAKSHQVGVLTQVKLTGKWKSLRLEVLRKKVLVRLRTEAAAGTGAVSADGAGRCSGEVSTPGRKRLLSKTKENNSSSSSATTNEQSAKCRKGEGQ